MSLGVVGAGQFAGQFAKLFRLHPELGDIYVTDLLPERAERARRRESLAGTVAGVRGDARVRRGRGRDLHPALAARRDGDPGAEAGKHVYSAVPMAIEADEIAAIIERSRRPA